MNWISKWLGRTDDVIEGEIIEAHVYENSKGSPVDGIPLDPDEALGWSVAGSGFIGLDDDFKPITK